MGDFDRGIKIVVMGLTTILLLAFGGLAAVANGDPLSTVSLHRKFYFTTVETGCNERCVCYYLLRIIDYNKFVAISIPVHIAHCKVQNKCVCTRVKKMYLPCSIKVSKCEKQTGAPEGDCSKDGCICAYYIKAGIWIFDKVAKEKKEKVVIEKNVYNAPYDLGCRSDTYDWCSCNVWFDKSFRIPKCELQIFACEAIGH